uniref:Multimerin-2-like n=1 Tax=Crassostrea virginica TaxID=6565 RepID=A0A8B8AJ59_CRAVI|nr:multimerin-2-like [Crassostrea virginica]
MKMICLYGLVFVAGIHSAAVSLLTDEIPHNSTSVNMNEISAKNMDVFRQLLNQEPLIRMTMVKNVHSLMKDMVTMQQNLAEAENKISSIQTSTDREISELNKQFERLKMENDALKNSSKVHENEIMRLKENLENVTQTLADVKVEVRYLSITVFGIDTHTKHIDNVVEELKNWTRKIEFEMMENLLNYTGAISDLETRHLKYIDDLIDTTNFLKADIDQHESAQLKMSATVSSLELFRLNKTLSKCDSDLKIGFTAGVTSGSSSWNSGTLVFPVVITNLGNGYNPSDGVFTAPTAGVYVFFVNVQSYDTKSIYVDIVLNGATKVRTMAYSYAGHGYHEAGPNLAVLSLQTGDRVWVKHHAGQGYHTNSDSPLTTFSGFLI